MGNERSSKLANAESHDWEALENEELWLTYGVSNWKCKTCGLMSYDEAFRPRWAEHSCTEWLMKEALE